MAGAGRCARRCRGPRSVSPPHGGQERAAPCWRSHPVSRPSRKRGSLLAREAHIEGPVRRRVGDRERRPGCPGDDDRSRRWPRSEPLGRRPSWSCRTSVGRASRAWCRASSTIWVTRPARPCPVGRPTASPAPGNQVLLVIDGLGAEQLGARSHLAPVLSGGAGQSITSVAPSTTACALTTLVTGRVPAEHGVVGYRVSPRR